MIRAGDNLALGWARLMIEELWRLGLRDLCFAPGSRSAPLTLAASEQGRVRCHAHFDERGLGFLALGLARQSRRPVAVVTTSGTAVANLYPAVIEARLSGIPLIVLSADRPPELIDCGANQTITQPGIFAGYPLFAQNLPAPSATISPRFVLGSLDQMWHCLQQTPGPAHLNCPFAEPFYPGEGTALAADWPTELASWRASEQPLTRIVAPTLMPDVPATWPELAQRRGVIVAGQIDDAKDAHAVAALAQHLGWPLLADAQSQLLQHPQALSHADLALHNAAFRAALADSEVLLQVGGRLLSKRLAHFIAEHAWQQYWQLAAHDQRLSADYRVDCRLVAPIAAACRLLQQRSADQAPWLQQGTLRAGLPAILNTVVSDWGELGITHRLASLWQGALLLGNSLPPRLWQMLAPVRPAEPLPGQLHSQRGASGIDGLIATAAGIARARPQGDVTTLLLGDTSALHDLNSLALLRTPEHPLIVVVLNNDGGGIFALLPGAATLPQHDACFRLNHGLDFAHAAAQFALDYAAPGTLDDFEHAYRTACAARRSTLIECRVPAGHSAEQLAELARQCRGAEAG
ncbi:MAG: 2-succinyl-5-enolpyruvyl-6-hydroxy-3-cyclohexene-1-carboxylic-acid synthase [Aeromonadaceae bacterium]